MLKITFLVSPTSIKNITVLASYLEMSPVLEKIPSLAEQMGVADFDFEDLKKKASELPEMTVDGLKKFVDAGFGTVTKMKTPMKTGDKRKPNQANKKKEPAVKKPKVKTINICSVLSFLLLGRGRTSSSNYRCSKRHYNSSSY